MFTYPHAYQLPELGSPLQYAWVDWQTGSYLSMSNRSTSLAPIWLPFDNFKYYGFLNPIHFSLTIPSCYRSFTNMLQIRVSKHGNKMHDDCLIWLWLNHVLSKTQVKSWPQDMNSRQSFGLKAWHEIMNSRHESHLDQDSRHIIGQDMSHSA